MCKTAQKRGKEGEWAIVQHKLLEKNRSFTQGGNSQFFDSRLHIKGWQERELKEEWENAFGKRNVYFT